MAAYNVTNASHLRSRQTPNVIIIVCRQGSSIKSVSV